MPNNNQHSHRIRVHQSLQSNESKNQLLCVYMPSTQLGTLSKVRQLLGILAIVATAMLGISSVASGQAAAGSKKVTPLSLVEKVGNRIIANTPFQFRLVPSAVPKVFDFVQFVDFGRTFGTSIDATAMAYTVLEADRDTTITLETSFAGKLEVFNESGTVLYAADKGKKVALISLAERTAILSNSFSLKLKAGSNQLLFRNTVQAGLGQWVLYVQPKGATIEFSEVKGLRLSIAKVPNVTAEVAALSNWLVVGPIKTSSIMAEAPIFRIGDTYLSASRQDKFVATWGIPRVEIFADLINSHPLWGTYYTYNYHAAGVAWAMLNLSAVSNKPQYKDFCRTYLNWLIDNKPLIQYQVDGLNGFRSAQHHQFHTPLLDFTTAPCLPFVAYLESNKRINKSVMAKLTDAPDIPENPAFKKFVDSIQYYVKNLQVRLPDGTFTRETPVKYTTWVDDMFMGIPFLVHSSIYATDPKEKAQWLAKAVKQVKGFHKHVYDAKANLYFHAQYQTNPKAIPHWSRANGWGIWATSEVLKYLPKSDPSYKTLLGYYKAHVTALVKLQDQKTGFWHQILDDKTSYPETSGTAIFTMAIARGINNGWLDAKTYTPIANKGWEAIASQIDDSGSVSNICVGTMSSEDAGYYKGRPTAPNDSHGLLGVLFAGMEMEQLTQK